VTIHFPWGSLLRGAIAEDEAVLDAICGLVRTGGTLTVLLSLVERDGRAPLAPHDVARIARAYRERGLLLERARAATRDDVAASRSSWGKRLDVGGSRPGTLLRFTRESA
jgi:hypothetical protein